MWSCSAEKGIQVVVQGEPAEVVVESQQVEQELGGDVFDSLPDEMLVAVATLLPLGTRQLCRAVSRRWRALVGAPLPQDVEGGREGIREQCISQWPLAMMPQELWSKKGNEICELAGRVGRLDVLQCARHKACPWDEWTCAYAALGGHLEVLKWARLNGCPWNERTCAWAAREGHLEVLKWLRLNGCPWDESTCIEAAKRGHPEVLKWAQDNGCPWGEETS